MGGAKYAKTQRLMLRLLHTISICKDEMEPMIGKPVVKNSKDKWKNKGIFLSKPKTEIENR